MLLPVPLPVPKGGTCYAQQLCTPVTIRPHNSKVNQTVSLRFLYIHTRRNVAAVPLVYLQRRVRTLSHMEGLHHSLNRRTYKSQPHFHFLPDCIARRVEYFRLVIDFYKWDLTPLATQGRERYVKMNARIENYWSQHASSQETSID